jgi:hypothetical protein
MGSAPSFREGLCPFEPQAPCGRPTYWPEAHLNAGPPLVAHHSVFPGIPGLKLPADGTEGAVPLFALPGRHSAANHSVSPGIPSLKLPAHGTGGAVPLFALPGCLSAADHSVSPGIAS